MQNFLDILSKIAALLGTITLFVGFVGTVLEWSQEPGKLVTASIVGYVVLAGGVIWFAFKSLDTEPKWRWGSLTALYMITVLFFSWLGAQVIVDPVNSCPSPLMTCYDFEVDADLEEWQGEIQKSSDYSFNGQYSLKATQSIQADQETRISLVWQHEIAADVIVGQVYWPESDDFRVEWAQVCVPVSGWACVSIPGNRGGWNTFVLDLSEMTVGDPPKSLDELVLPGLYFQGRLSGSTDTNITTMPMYVDAIQIYRDGSNYVRAVK